VGLLIVELIKVIISIVIFIIISIVKLCKKKFTSSSLNTFARSRWKYRQEVKRQRAQSWKGAGLRL